MAVRFPTQQILGAAFLLLAVSFATPLWAQKDAGAIVGLVRDATGAVITDAKVTVIDLDRGTQLTLFTNLRANMLPARSRSAATLSPSRKQDSRKQLPACSSEHSGSNRRGPDP